MTLWPCGICGAPSEPQVKGMLCQRCRDAFDQHAARMVALATRAAEIAIREEFEAAQRHSEDP